MAINSFPFKVTLQGFYSKLNPHASCQISGSDAHGNQVYNVNLTNNEEHELNYEVNKAYTVKAAAEYFIEIDDDNQQTQTSFEFYSENPMFGSKRINVSWNHIRVNDRTVIRQGSASINVPSAGKPANNLKLSLTGPKSTNNRFFFLEVRPDTRGDICFEIKGGDHNI